MSDSTIVIFHHQMPERLDKFLISTYPEYSRSYFQKLIDDGHVLINNAPASKSSYKLKNGDIISIYFAPAHEFNLSPLDVPFDIVAMHEDFLVINKPAGLVVHNALTSPDEPSLVRGLLYRFKEFHEFDDTERPGIIHRLDKDTSGLILIARNHKAQIALSKLFKDRLVKKTYLAVVTKHPVKTGSIDFDIGRHPVHRHKMSHQGIASRDALTHYEVLAYYKDASLVAASPVTGRTHQIRVHLTAIGHGLLGDATYGLTSKLIKRQALHAWRIAFSYKGIDYKFQQSVPADIASLLSALHGQTKN